MAEEPIYIMQVDQDPSLHVDWIEQQSKKAAKLGVRFARVSKIEKNSRAILFEGWASEQDDPGDPRWS